MMGTRMTAKLLLVVHGGGGAGRHDGEGLDGNVLVYADRLFLGAARLWRSADALGVGMNPTATTSRRKRCRSDLRVAAGTSRQNLLSCVGSKAAQPRRGRWPQRIQLLPV
jgi:hypothetical protein